MLCFVAGVPIHPDSRETPCSQCHTYGVLSFVYQAGDIKTIVIHSLIIVRDRRGQHLRPSDFNSVDVGFIKPQTADMELCLTDLLIRVKGCAQVPRRK